MKKLLYPLLILVLGFAGCTPSNITETETTYDDGSPKTVRTYLKDKDDLILESEKTYYKTGELKMEGNYNNGKRQGKWISYYKDGTKWAEATYKNGKEYGTKSVYYKNGKVYYTGKMEAGERIGQWTFYDVDGNKSTIDYDERND